MPNYFKNTFSKLFLSNNLASFAFDPPAKIKLPSILLNWPEYKKIGSGHVLKLASQSITDMGFPDPKSQVLNYSVYVHEQVRITPSLVSMPSPQIKGPYKCLI